jgi:hypothetical protein
MLSGENKMLLTRESVRFIIHTPLIPRGVIKLAFAWDEKAAQLGGFFTFGETGLRANEKPPKKTAVYIDGYNLYYGRLRGTAFKWLNVVSLFDAILAHRDQNESLARVNFFTAPALKIFRRL